MMEEESAARLPTPQRDYSIALTTIPHIAKLILRNLEIRDLLSCKVVCSLWKDVVNEIIRGKFYILRKKIELEDMQKAIEKPEIVLHYLKLPRKTDVQLITEYSNIIAKECSLCWHNLHGIRTAPNFLYHVTIRGLLYVNSILESFENKLQCKHPLDFAIFPTLPGVQMLRFPCHLMRTLDRSDLQVLSVAESLRLPKEDLKCVIWFSRGSTEELFMRNQDYAVAGVSTICLKNSDTIGIAFHGNRVKAASMNFYNPLLYNEDLSEPSFFSKNHIQALQKYKIDQNKCIAFMFSTYHRHCSNRHILFLFKQSFPDVPIIYYRCRYFFGNDYMPGMKAYMPLSQTEPMAHMPDRNTNNSSATLVLVWYD